MASTRTLLEVCTLCRNKLASVRLSNVHVSIHMHTLARARTHTHTHTHTPYTSGGLDVVKQELFQLQMASREGSLAHPKLHQLVKIVSRWMREERRNRSEKVRLSSRMQDQSRTWL